MCIYGIFMVKIQRMPVFSIHGSIPVYVTLHDLANKSMVRFHSLTHPKMVVRIACSSTVVQGSVTKPTDQPGCLVNEDTGYI